jgi:hypothetical protein
MFTERSSVGDSDDRGRTFAADANVGIGEFFNFTGVLGVTSNKEAGEPALTSDREAIVLSTTYRDANWQFGGFYDRVGANFNPELGFLRRSDFQEVGGTAWRFIRVPQWTWLRELRPHTSYDISYGLDSGIKETYDWHIDLHIVWENGALFSTATDLVYEGLTEPLRLTTGVDDQGERTFVEVAPGEYTGWLFSPRYSTSTQAPVVVNTTLAIGQFFSGRRVGGNTQVSFQFGGALAGEIGLEYNKIDLPEPGGDFDTTLASARVGYSFTPNVFVQSLVQYSTQTEVWSGNIRFGWVDTAGTGLFLVYNERQSEKFVGAADGLLERTVSVKFSRQIDVAGIGRDRFGW